MKQVQNSKKILVLTASLLLIGCSPNDSSHNGVLQSISSSKHELTIQTIEFSSADVVTNVGVTIFDYFTGEEIASVVVDAEGKAVFPSVKQDTPYKIAVYRILSSGEWLEQTKQDIVFDKNKPLISIETFNTNHQSPLDVPIVLQNPELPNGCEVTALAAILNYYGMKVDKMDLANNYLPKQPVTKKGDTMYGPDPNVAYAGDPSKKSGGYYVYASPIVEVANEVLFEQNSEFRAMNLSDASKKEILNYVQSGVPVLAWVTIDLKKPRTKGHWVIKETNEKHPIFMNLHAVVVTGYHNGKVTVMNPLSGQETIDEKVFFESFKSLGSHAIVIL
ncbi:C39 family peptidase [Lysinibacillus endophyticus]|uniref:C39 family peptidase n=1 Tax=Ureibacillus endophyticus TaxID=1978490 RepID=UPI00313728A5